MSAQITSLFKARKIERKQSKGEQDGVSRQQDSGPSQNAFTSDLDVLKQFDLDWQYGPCTGLSRMERWQRANKYNMDPPEHVRRIVQQHPDDEQYTKCLWKDYDL